MCHVCCVVFTFCFLVGGSERAVGGRFVVSDLPGVEYQLRHNFFGGRRM